jgi:predicted nucleic acid-binding protein
MGQALSSEALEQGALSSHRVPLAFLDTDVIVGYLGGEAAALELFSAEAKGRIHFAINPIVLQELLLGSDVASRPEIDIIRDLQVLPVDFAKAEALVPKARALRALRNRLVHSNDILVVTSANDCDFLVTSKTILKDLVASDKPEVITPEELVSRLRAA